MANQDVHMPLQELLALVGMKKKELEEKSVQRGVFLKNATRSTILANVLSTYVSACDLDNSPAVSRQQQHRQKQSRGQKSTSVSESETASARWMSQQRTPLNKQAKQSELSRFFFAVKDNKKQTLTALDTNLPLVLAFLTTKEICLFCCVSKTCNQAGRSPWLYSALICEGLTPRAVRSVLSRPAGLSHILHLSLWKVADLAPTNAGTASISEDEPDISALSPLAPRRLLLEIAQKGYLKELLSLDLQGCAWVDLPLLSSLSRFCPKVRHVDARGTGPRQQLDQLRELWPLLRSSEIRPSLWKELFLGTLDQVSPVVRPDDAQHSNILSMPAPLLDPSTQTALTFEFDRGDEQWPAALKFPALRALAFDTKYCFDRPGIAHELVICEDEFPCLEELNVRNSCLHVDSQRLRKLSYCPRKHGKDVIRSLHAPNLQVLHFKTDYRNYTTPEVWKEFLNTAGALRVLVISLGGSPYSTDPFPSSELACAVQLSSLRMLSFTGALTGGITLRFQRDLAVLSFTCGSDARATFDFRRCRKLTWVQLDSAAQLSSLTSLAISSLAYLRVGKDDTKGAALDSVEPGVLQVLRIERACAKSVVSFLRRANAIPNCRLQWLEVESCPDQEEYLRSGPSVPRSELYALRQRRAKEWFVTMLEQLGALVLDGGMSSLVGFSVGNSVWLRGCTVAPSTGGRHGAGCFGSVGYFESRSDEAEEGFRAEGVRRFGTVIQSIVQRVSVMVGEREEDVAVHLRDDCSFSKAVPGFDWALAGWRSRR